MLYSTASSASSLGEGMRSLLGRTEASGYGPTRPRFAAVVVVPPPPPGGEGEAEEEEGERRLLDSTARAVESIFRSADRNRIFVVAVVMDGRRQNDGDGGGDDGGSTSSSTTTTIASLRANFETRLTDVDMGKTAHRHGDRAHVHRRRDGGEGEEEGGGGEGGQHAHSSKVHVIYNRRTLGVSASRDAGTRFVNALVGEHERAGLKSAEEGMILLFLRCDSTLREEQHPPTTTTTAATTGEREEEEDGVVVVVGRTWLDDVTDALIPTPVQAGEGDDGGTGESTNDDAAAAAAPGAAEGLRPSAPANAVSFAVDHSAVDASGDVVVRTSSLGTTSSFDRTLRVVRATASGQDMALSDGASYPAPLTTAATALRLDTYNALPAADGMLANHLAADLQLSLNLWMCADGMDVLPRARVVVDPSVLGERERDEVTGPLAARIVGAWMSGHEDEAYADGILRAVASSAASSWWQDGGAKPPSDRALSDKTREMKDLLVRIASEARQTASFPLGLERKCRPFSWYVRHVNPELEIRDDDQPDPHASLARMPAAGGGKDEKLLPSRPLDDLRMAIVVRASPVKLAYVDASGGHVAHPHLGATDENGVFGYVHDETALRNKPPPFEIKDDRDRERLCMKGDPNYTMLTQKVFVDITNHEAAERRAEHDLAKKRVKLFCFVYTIEKNHDRIPAIRETWGQKCDGFMVVSTKTDKDLGTVNIPHEGPEEYNNIWQKVRAMWSYIYDNYYEKYDYFHIGGDDLYLIVENLRLYLESEEIQLASNGGRYLPDGTEDTQTPLFLGRRFAENGDRNRMFISGGSGYTMNKAALKTLVVDAFPQCFPHMHTFSEDVMVAACLRKVRCVLHAIENSFCFTITLTDCVLFFDKMDILPYDTKDEAGGERYMPFEPGHHLTYKPPKNPKDDWYSNYSVDVKWGIDHCAAKSVAFHYIKGPLMRRMHAILYHRCGQGSQLTAADEAAAKLRAQKKADDVKQKAPDDTVALIEPQRTDGVADEQKAPDDAAAARLMKPQKAYGIAAEQMAPDVAAAEKLIKPQKAGGVAAEQKAPDDTGALIKPQKTDGVAAEQKAPDDAAAEKLIKPQRADGVAAEQKVAPDDTGALIEPQKADDVAAEQQKAPDDAVAARLIKPQRADGVAAEQQKAPDDTVGLIKPQKVDGFATEQKAPGDTVAAKLIKPQKADGVAAEQKAPDDEAVETE
ncbi:hypothetical protein ACHAW5_003968 [Stephanodiscus triporus]|uniref:N-acetylgalactosaminide beta-1,3-galactosyltransferase n=1 Tax=Stephanodiscus triporus TaxID=2934178 RepID=A0ABD3NDQ0_9STRA